jgi:hypothetical protein
VRTVTIDSSSSDPKASRLIFIVEDGATVIRFTGRPDVDGVIHVGRNKVAQSAAGTAQTHQAPMTACRAIRPFSATEIPAWSAFAWSGLPCRE